MLAEAQAAHRSPGGRVLYATQGATDPPTFTLFATKSIPAPYLRYLERRIRSTSTWADAAGVPGSPAQLLRGYRNRFLTGL